MNFKVSNSDKCLIPWFKYIIYFYLFKGSNNAGAGNTDDSYAWDPNVSQVKDISCV